MNVLALDVSGLPRKWIGFEEAILYHAKNQVAWSLGEVVARYRGGYQRDGTQSILETPSIIAVKGKGWNVSARGRVVLTNRTLFARDLHLCAYCGERHTTPNLSRDHVIPKSRGGADSWTNVVSACRGCNHAKGARTPEEAHMQLLYVPYAPNHYENLILQNRKILADQMEYLLSGVPRNSRMWQ